MMSGGRSSAYELGVMNSTSRGRGGNRGGVKKPVLPNISAAGRKESSANDADPGPSRGRGDGRRGRRGGRGGGRGRGAKQSNIIQSEGIFSVGLADHGGRQRGSKRETGDERIVGRVDEARLAKREESDGEEPDGADRSSNHRITYETQWLSDEEADAEELVELLNDGFISDLRKGTEMPIVLPPKDAPQFRQILSRKAKLSVGSDVDMKDALRTDASTAKIKYEVFSDGSDNEAETATVQKSVRAGTAIRRLLHTEDGSLMLLQLPTSLSTIAAKMKITEGDANSSVVERAEQSKPTTTNPASAETGQNCVEAFPTGAEIGRVQLLRSGRVVMTIAGQTMDVSQAIPTGCFDVAARVEVPTVDNAPSLKPDIGMASSIFGGSPSAFTPVTNGGLSPGLSSAAARRPTSSVQVYGEISNSFVCSYNFHSALRLATDRERKSRSLKGSPTRAKKS